MFFLTLVVGVAFGLLVWNYFVENVERLDVAIPESKNITFNDSNPLPMTTAQIANELEKSDGKPVLIYLYTTWCKICNENFANFNEIAREFQNTDLQVFALAIDRDLDSAALSSHLKAFGDLYFQKRFLASKQGFKELLVKNKINYDNRIPFTVLLSNDGEVVLKFTGKRNKNYLRNKIIKELYE